MLPCSVAGDMARGPVWLNVYTVTVSSTLLALDLMCNSDLALIERFGLTVHGFDPTPRVAEWLQNNPPPDALKFYPLGLAWTDGELQFAAPTEAESYLARWCRLRWRIKQR